MAVVADRVVVELMAKIDGYNRNVIAAERQFGRSMRSIETNAKRAERSSAASFANIAKGFLTGVAVQNAARLIDTSVRITNSLKVAGLEGDELSKVYDKLFASAQRNSAPLESLTQLYGRLALVQDTLGVSTSDLIKFTDNIAIALRVGGTSAQEASGALLQLSQALGGGIVRAEEFNSIIEGTPTIARAVANGLVEAGGSVAKLRTLVVDGKVASAAFFAAFQVGAADLAAQAATSETTISQSFVRLQNVLIDVAGKFNEGANASEQFGRFLDFVGNRVTNFASNLEKGDTIIQRTFGSLFDAIEEFGRLVDADNVGDSLVAQFDPVAGAARIAATEIHDAEQSLIDFGVSIGESGRFSEETVAKIQELIYQYLLTGKSAESARSEIIALYNADPDFSALGTSLDAMVQYLEKVRAKAREAQAAVEFRDIGEFPSFADISSTVGAPKKPVSLKDYDLPSTGGKGRKPSASETAALESGNSRSYALEARTAAMKEYTEATEQAAQAQLELYEGTASDAITGFISDIRSGVSAAEALSNVFNKIADQLIDMGVQGLVGQAFGAFAGGGQAGAGGPLRLGFNLPGFGGARAGGGPVGAGKSYLVGEDGPEMFVPRLPGVVVPNGQSANGGFTYAPVIDARGADQAAVSRLERVVARQGAEMESRVRAIVSTRAAKRW